MLDDEDTHEKTGGERRHRQRDPERNPRAKVHCSASGEKPSERCRELPEAAPQDGPWKGALPEKIGSVSGITAPSSIYNRKRLTNVSSSTMDATTQYGMTKIRKGSLPRVRFRGASCSLRPARSTLQVILVGERHGEFVPVQSLGRGSEPAAEAVAGPIVRAHQQDVSRLDQQGAQVS